MSKKIIQDVIPPSEKRSIRNIKLPTRTETSEKSAPLKNPAVNIKQNLSNDNVKTNFQVETEQTNNKPKEFLTIPTIKKTGWSSLYKVSILGGFLVAIGLVYLGYLFLNVNAIVIITPKTKEVAVKSLFTAKKNPQASDLPFEVINLEQEGVKTVPSTNEKKVENRASGRIIIYNDYNTQPQRLIRNTRLQTGDGLIFRLDSSVVVPGQTKKDGKLVPGSLEVLVSADTAGEEYNIPLSDFTIPGFKDDPRYQKFYGRSKTVMTGGFKGTVKTASAKDLENGKFELAASLKKILIAKAKEQIPSGFILFDNAIYIATESLSLKDNSEIKLKSSLHGIIFSKDILASFIAKATLSTPSDELVTSETLANLNFKPDSMEIAPWETGNLPFNLSGTTSLLWLVDKDKIQRELAGIAKNQVEEVFKHYSGIEKAHVELQPPWKSTLPEESDKIEIVIEKTDS